METEKKTLKTDLKNILRGKFCDNDWKLYKNK